MEVALILVPIFAFVVIKMVLEHRATARAENLRLLEEALRNAALDRGTLESLTYQLTGRRPLRSPGASGPMTLVLSIGWVALFVGIGLLVISGWFHEQDFGVAGILTAISGFGLVTWPFALRELEARKQTQ